MAPLPKTVTRALYRRDDYQCAATGDHNGLTPQHRRALGMGGSKSPVSNGLGNLLTLRADVNERMESDLMQVGLAFGWKVRAWITRPSIVPVLYRVDGVWRMLREDGSRDDITSAEAWEVMRNVYGPEWERWRAVARASAHALAEL